MRLNYDEEDKVEVQMSPLIDCVFLLLIFFLVTTMMKKWECKYLYHLLQLPSALLPTAPERKLVFVPYKPPRTQENKADFRMRLFL